MRRTKWAITFTSGVEITVEAYEQRVYNGVLLFDTTGNSYPERFDTRFPLVNIQSYVVVGD